MPCFFIKRSSIIICSFLQLSVPIATRQKLDEPILYQIELVLIEKGKKHFTKFSYYGRYKLKTMNIKKPTHIALFDDLSRHMTK